MTPAEMGAARYAELQRRVEAIPKPPGVSRVVVTWNQIEVVLHKLPRQQFYRSARFLFDIGMTWLDLENYPRGDTFERLLYLAAIATEIRAYREPREDADGHQIGAGATHG